MIRVAEEARRAVRVMERNTEVVFRIRICSLDLLLLLHQGKRKEATLRNAVKQKIALHSLSFLLPTVFLA
jgi:hypothetical protein